MNPSDSAVRPGESITPTLPAARIPVVPRRRNLWPIVTAGLGALLALLVGLYFILAWSHDRDLQAAFEETDRLDPRWRMADLQADRVPIADDANPAVIVRSVDKLLRPGGFDLGQKNWQLFDDLKSVARLNGMQASVLHEALAKHAEAVQLARTLKERTAEGRFGITHQPDFVSTNLEPLQRCRGVMAMLNHDAMLRAEDGDAAGAMESCRALLAATRAIGDEPYLIAALIRFAGENITVAAVERVLAQGEVPGDELQAMQQLMEKEAEAPILIQALRGERAGFDEFIDGVAKGKVKFGPVLGGPVPGWQGFIVDRFPVVITRGRAEHLRLMNQTVEAAQLPDDKQGDAFAHLDKVVRDSSTPLVRLLMPAVSKIAFASRRSHANLRCAAAALAAERFRLLHDRWPESLATLVEAGLIAAIPIDPFDGQPLRYKGLPDGILIYSVGPDGIDNGGNINHANPMQPGTDVGFQLWDVGARRQAPMPVRLPDDAGGPP